MNRKALRRIPLSKLMDLKVDFAFKQLFGSERNKHITVVFLNAILQRTKRDSIKEITFLNQEMGGEYEGDKQARLDIVVKTQADEYINIEIQLANHDNMLKRTMFYWSSLYNAQLQRGQGYSTLMPTVTIIICQYTLLPKQLHYHNTYHLYEDTTLQRLDPQDDVVEIHFIEMKKFLQAWFDEQVNPVDDLLVRWLLLLGMVDARKHKIYDEIYVELEELAMHDESLRQAFTAWEEMSQTPESIIAYQSRLKYVIDEEANLYDAKMKGIEQGKEVAIIEFAQKMMAQGFTDEEIVALTDLTLERLQQLRIHDK
ncbi:Rpn family recombination-promoting nuclease/putative transposase [Lysinibacillus piscis]|uniref:Transposase n=1 Tax=Lysinibacillus piscis TaxID=2518931 RepID=A0ABQ5NGT3_9BACI|nr:Rpn family recombination-promoting nuclease/putative transposase [Lysinibacillus sp. KH24]GLC87276.1 transposase [Lysinibacillus sp. KH24]